MRPITHIVLHCTGTPQTTTVASIQRYWRNVKGWRLPGYHRIILANGTVQTLAPDSQKCNGVAGHNYNSIHISYIGGIDAAGKAIDNRTVAQRRAMLDLVRQYKAAYPNAAVCGHRDFAGVRKACPSFDVKTWLRSVAPELL